MEPIQPRRGHLMRETKAAILEALSGAPEWSMPSRMLKRRVMRETGCSEHTYAIAARDLARAGQIERLQTDESPYWFVTLTDTPE